MHVLVDESRAFWREMIGPGRCASIPRWTLDPVPGIGEHRATVPDALASAWRRVGDELAVSPAAVLLAAHAKVLAALTGDTEVVTGYVTVAGDRPVPCRLEISGATWRRLVADAARVEERLQQHRRNAIDELLAELDPDAPVFETVLDPSGAAGLLDARTVLRIGIAVDAECPVLRLEHRTDVLDAEQAARIAGYHLAALDRLAADLDADHEECSLLSDAELSHQLHGLAGPTRDVPDLRVHELFERRVRAHPDRVAAAHAGTTWTYRELNAHANRLAHALLASGSRPETVVAVVTERNLYWLAAVLAVFKAGAAYLPVEPHFPPDRIARTLARAECELVLTEHGATGNLDAALESRPPTQKLFIDDLLSAGLPADDPHVAVSADQLAYIYFTSGSTGEPKGAMCEHAGMSNHLSAKIADLEIADGQVVAQVAPQCFDISLWQLVSALLVGGRTLLIEQDVILDVPRFVDTIATNEVAVLQVVPSYLEAVVSYLERNPRPLPALHYISATGEALPAELIRRLFRIARGVKLVNAYGLTETSDDTNHEVMDRPPDTDRVPLGRPIQNVQVYVLDERLRPVPLGAPGLIAFSGVCVGRGYINDPERTRAVYLLDPHRPGQRLYLGGDYGRWLPGGKLEFLGRKDNQVKISGFRIEIGDVENALLQVPGIRNAAVVTGQPNGAGTQLVAFFSGSRIDADTVRGALGATLPGYMIPSAVHWRDELPVTANGKIDRKQLTALANSHAAQSTVSAPRTPTEQRLASAWASVLGIGADRISRSDSFFDSGGTSLAAVKLAIALDRAISLRDIARHPGFAELAHLIDARASSPSASP